MSKPKDQPQELTVPDVIVSLSIIKRSGGIAYSMLLSLLVMLKKNCSYSKV